MQQGPQLQQEVFGVGHLARIPCGDGEEHLSAAEVFLTGPPATAHTATTHDAHLRTVTLPLPLLHKTAGQVGGPASPLAFTALRPATPAMTDHWQTTAAYATAVLDRPEYATAPVLSALAQLLAATVLAVFPNTATSSGDATDQSGTLPATLRRATAFIEEHADRDIALADIAAAAYITPRALQYAFRRHLDTTPLAYLREARLRHAHRDLLEADPALTTVTEIATHWGFLHPGRFATRYQALFHCPPSATLHT